MTSGAASFITSPPGLGPPGLGSSAAVRLTRVSRHWAGVAALDDVSINVQPGSFAVLLGPSGCGKTTCLRIIAGLETASSGTVEIGGRDVTNLPPAGRGVAMVFQSYALFPHLTVAENIVFGLKARRVPPAERARRLDRAVEILGVGALLHRKPSQLSGGQQQRVALGRAIVAEAPVCLMDEPLSNLDAQLRADMRREILALQRRLGITMLYVTHDQTEAMSMADQIVLLRDGHIEQDAPPEELYASPSTCFVASFIGTPPMNLFPLERRGTDLVLRGTEGPVLASAMADTAIGGIRPEHLRLAEAGIPALVRDTEYLGADTVMTCSAGAATLLVRLPGRVILPAGTPVCLALDEPVHLFDAATGRRCGIRGSKAMSVTRRRAMLSGTASLALPAILRAQQVTEISFYFPVAVGGPITKIIDGYAADFQRENPAIKVTPIYAGTYQDTLTKAQTALKAGSGPQMAVLLSTDVFSLIDDDLILPFDTLAKDAEDKIWLDSFYPAFLKNGQIGGHLWGIPFQRSTIVLYWNKTAFASVGLDPARPPATWQEHAEFAAKLTSTKAGKVDRWGTQIPSSGFPYWLFQALATEAGGTLANAAGVVTDFAGSPCVKALRYWLLLNTEYHAHPPGIVEWGTTPRDFLEQKVAMIWTTTGNLTNIRNSAKFPFGVAMLPAGKQRGSPTGGGNFYLFKSATDPQRLACLRLLRWITSRERAARWGIDTGYVATRPDAWDTAEMRDYVSGFPAAAVARDQLRYAVPELSTHENQRVTKALNDALQAALVGLRDPEQALEEAQEAATRLLRPFR